MVKDLGAVAVEGGKWEIYVGGAAGSSVRKGDVLCVVDSEEDVLKYMGRFVQYYRENANYLERTYDFVERYGIEKVRKETVYAPESQKKALLQRLQKSKTLSRDAWLERDTPMNSTQFVQIQPMESLVQ